MKAGKPITLAAVVASRIPNTLTPQGECLIYTGPTNRDGYGRVRTHGHGWLAHRIAFFIYTGVDPGDMLVCHTCDNPPCCKREHLYLGDQALNMYDARLKKRLNPKPPRGEANRSAKLTEAQVKEIRRLYAAGVSQGKLGPLFGVRQAHISDIVLRKSWKHVH